MSPTTSIAQITACQNDDCQLPRARMQVRSLHPKTVSEAAITVGTTMYTPSAFTVPTELNVFAAVTLHAPRTYTPPIWKSP